jgi:hypothetical protein
MSERATSFHSVIRLKDERITALEAALQIAEARGKFYDEDNAQRIRNETAALLRAEQAEATLQTAERQRDALQAQLDRVLGLTAMGEEPRP